MERAYYVKNLWYPERCIIRHTYSIWLANEHKESKPADRAVHCGVPDHGAYRFCAFGIFESAQINQTSRVIEGNEVIKNWGCHWPPFHEPSPHPDPLPSHPMEAERGQHANVHGDVAIDWLAAGSWIQGVKLSEKSHPPR
jgi:hypothetical protein